ncbi:unnamed protein product [Spirodela intermedia]|uniref:Protein phosphatase n=1 Tax=Spirodela intermedia TaxID=51605 RepID=A0A7I8JBT9_SPIIN|nr:unnamed protein product [Spirodela intermedia]CAA6667431.1 unnamed protein product [Spirodela intermedia]
MAACGSLLGRVELSVRNLDSLSRNRQMMKFMTWVDVPDRSRQIDCYRSADPGRQIDCYRGVKNLKSREPRGKNMSYRCFWSNIQGKSWSSSPLLEAGAKRFDASPASSYSTRAASDVTFDGSAKQDQLDNPAVSPDQRVVGERKLRLSSGSCYLPHPAKEETGGEDAHFICVAEQAIGVADGVGGWADLGVDSGLYARELMSHSVSAIQEEPKGSIDPVRVLERAHSSTKARGSSTACIIALTDQGINAINLGDSGFMLVRDGSVVFQSPPQQHDFNFPYQLESGNLSDPPSSAQVFTVPVAAGDAIVAGTDGLFDNLFGKEVTAVVARAEIAALARRRALDRNGQTPFSTAAQEAGYWYTGGKLDDITVVVSFVTSFDQ